LSVELPQTDANFPYHADRQPPLQIRDSKRVVADISMHSVQGHRAVKAVPVPPGGTLHDYVPFYFAPRSPMLRTLEGGNVPD